MDKMKARCWYENKLPVFKIEENSLEMIKDNITNLLDIACESSELIKKYLRQVWCEQSKNKAYFQFIDKIFWEGSERDFYICLEKILNPKEDFYRILESWLNQMKKFAIFLFDQQTLSALSEDLDLRKIIKASTPSKKFFPID